MSARLNLDVLHVAGQIDVGVGVGVGERDFRDGLEGEVHLAELDLAGDDHGPGDRERREGEVARSGGDLAQPQLEDDDGKCCGHRETDPRAGGRVAQAEHEKKRDDGESGPPEATAPVVEREGLGGTGADLRWHGHDHLADGRLARKPARHSIIPRVTLERLACAERVSARVREQPQRTQEAQKDVEADGTTHSAISVCSVVLLSLMPSERTLDTPAYAPSHSGVRQKWIRAVPW